MLSRKAFWTVTLAVAVIGVAGGALIGDSLIHQPSNHAEAAWAEVFDAPAEMASRVDSIVVAKAISVAPGRVAYSENGEDALPYEVFEFQVTRPVKGLGESTIFVERAGGEGMHLDVDGGAFEIGSSYLLFLKRGENGLYYQVNNQGRFRIANGRLTSTEKGDVVVDSLTGRSLAEGLRMLRVERPVVQ
jgi:hypothetical protein